MLSASIGKLCSAGKVGQAHKINIFVSTILWGFSLTYAYMLPIASQLVIFKGGGGYMCKVHVR